MGAVAQGDGMRCPVAALAVVAVFLLACEEGEGYAPLHVEGQGGFWNQVVVGADKAFPERIGGITVRGSKPVASFVDRETPTDFAKRWDLRSTGERLEVRRGRDNKLMSLNKMGNAIFKGKMKIDGVMRVQNLALDGVQSNPGDDESTLKIGTAKTSSMQLGSNAKGAWIQTDAASHLVFNPRNKQANLGVVMFSEAVPKHTVDAHGDMYAANSVKLGKLGKTTLEGNKVTFAMGGGWTSTGAAWISSLKTKPVQMGGAVFGTRLGIGTEVKTPGVRLEVHNGHFVVTSKVGALLKGLTTYMMPEGAHVKAYDYTRKKLQKWRITGTTIFLNPGQKSDGRVCIGCEKPEHHLQSEGNMYVNGNVYVNKHLHVKGHMHIDKIITPRVFIHSRIETPKYGRGFMIGNDLPNKWKTKTNMRMGYNEKFAWIQSHKEVPLVINPIGGATCIGCKTPSKTIELEVGGDSFVNGEMFVATLKKKKKKTEAPAPAPSEMMDDALIQEGEFSLSEAKSVLAKEMGAAKLNVMSAWSAATKIVQHNHRTMMQRREQMKKNEAAIAALEKQLSL